MPNEVKLLPCPLADELEAIRAGVDAFNPDARLAARSAFDAAEQVWKLVPKIIVALRSRPTTLVTDEVVERDKLIEALTPSAETKAAYIGEFSFTVMDRDDDGEEIPRRVLVPWDTTKEIMAAIRNRALASMPTVVTGEQPLQSLGVPASPSGHSRAEPEEVSALRASVPNASEAQRSESELLSGRALPCAICSTALDSCDWPNQPLDGIAFSSAGHYGTTVFDPMDGSRLELNLCDKCLCRAAEQKRVIHYSPANPKGWLFWRPPSPASADGRRMAETENTGSVPQGTTSAVGSEASETPTPSSAQPGDA